MEQFVPEPGVVKEAGSPCLQEVVFCKVVCHTKKWCCMTCWGLWPQVHCVVQEVSWNPGWPVVQGLSLMKWSSWPFTYSELYHTAGEKTDIGFKKLTVNPRVKRNQFRLSSFFFLQSSMWLDVLVMSTCTYHGLRGFLCRSKWTDVQKLKVIVDIWASALLGWWMIQKNILWFLFFF